MSTLRAAFYATIEKKENVMHLYFPGQLIVRHIKSTIALYVRRHSRIGKTSRGTIWSSMETLLNILAAFVR